MVIEGPLAPNFFMSTLYWPLLSFHVKIIKNWDLHLVSVPCKCSERFHQKSSTSTPYPNFMRNLLRAKLTRKKKFDFSENQL